MAEIKKKKKEKSKFGKIIKIGLITFGVLFLLLIAAAVAIPYFFRDELLELTKKEINKNINAEVNFSDVGLSIWKNFPDITFTLNDLEVTGVDQFEGINLASIGKLDLSMDIMSVIQKKEGQPIAIHSIGLVKPDINVLVLRDGSANYDIAKSTGETAEATEPTEFQLALSEYFIEDGNLVYDDRQGGSYLKIEGLNHKGKGDFTEAIYDIATTTKMDGLTLSSGGMSYLKNAKVNADITVNADMNTSKFTLKDNSININALRLDLDGFVQPKGNDVNMDMNFNAPSTKFKDFLSLIPGAYTKEFQDVTANGTFQFKGDVKGTLNETALPAFNLDFDVADGSFQYPDLPMGMKEINTNIKIASNSSDLDDIAIDVTKLHLLLGNNPFDAQLKLRTPLSDPDVDAIIDGIIDLEDISKAFPMEGVQSMKGKITADIAVKTKMSYIDNEEYEKVDMKGKMQLENIDYAAEGTPPILVNLAQMDFTPQNVKLNEFDAKIGKSDLKASGTLDNILAYFSPGKTMKGKLKLRSNYFDANEWLTEEEASTTSPAPTPIPTGEPTEVFDQFDFELDAEMKKISYEDNELLNTVAKGSFTPQKIDLKQLSTQVGKSDIKIDGELTNIFGFLFDNEIIGGNINLNSNLLDLNELMGYEETPVPASNAKQATPAADAEASGIILVPEYLDVTLNTDIKEVLYTNLDLKNMKGKVNVKNEKISLTDVDVDLLGGRMKLTGGYDTKDKAKPTFAFGYDINKFDFQKSFNTFNSFQSAAPIGEYIKGLFNSKLNLSGVMGKDMMPDLNSLSADGNFFTIDALVQNFIPLKAISNKLNIKYLNDDIRLTNTMNEFKVRDGRVLLEEFPIEYKDIKMRVGGSHGFDQSIDYVMSLDVPLALIEKGSVAGYAESGRDFLNGIAGKAGLNLDKLNLGDMVQIDLKLTGPMNKPNVKILKVKMSDSEGNSTKDALVDGIKDIVDDKIQEGKDLAAEKADELIDKANDKAEEAMDQVKDVAEDKVNEVVDQVKDEVGDKVEEVVGEQVKDATDKVKDQVGDKVDDALEGKAEGVKDGIDKWNPFKKKKKKDE
jgi:gas vesicle protein